VRHGRPAIALHMSCGADWVGIGVHDCGPDLPVEADAPDPQQPNGRGLLLVDTLSSRWGVTLSESEPGKTVWFELQP